MPAISVGQIGGSMIGSYGVGLVQMLENAGRSLAELALARFAPDSVTVLVGAGNNGGGGLVAARHLANRGPRPVRVRAYITARRP